MKARASQLAQLPLVLTTTATMLVLPVMIIAGVQVISRTTFPLIVTAALGACLSILFGQIGLRL